MSWTISERSCFEQIWTISEQLWTNYWCIKSGNIKTETITCFNGAIYYVCYILSTNRAKNKLIVWICRIIFFYLLNLCFQPYFYNEYEGFQSKSNKRNTDLIMTYLISLYKNRFFNLRSFYLVFWAIWRPHKFFVLHILRFS